MTAPTPEQVARWWRILDEHQPRYGRCPICGTRRCWVRAGALADLIANDVYYLGAFNSTPVDTSGGNTTVGEVEGARS
ncbi:hypothetical protein AB0I89_23895 [Micromonospora sp. NPDC049801]|uniref:hypothetical protein n=1 Tax=unclassified Micromonospora TaxID=2617518 RepID=UPI0033E3096B